MEDLSRMPSSYFTFSKPRDAKSQSSPQVSPGTSAYGRPTSRSSPRPSVRRTPTPRSVSNYLAYRPSLISQTIEEDAANQISATINSERQPHLLGDRFSPGAGDRPALARQSASSVQTSPPGTGKGGRAAAIKPSYRPKPGHVWTRTSSGSVWYERLKGSSSHSKQSSDPSTGSSVPIELLTPLKPPSSPSGSRGPPDQHQVKVEKSFTDLQAEKRPSADRGRSHPSAATERRQSSINPLKMFSAPLHLARKISLAKRKSRLKAQVHENNSPVHQGAEMRGHRSLLKRTHTSEALRQVTSILHTAGPSGNCSPVTIIAPIGSRQLSERSGSSRDSGEQQKHQMKANKVLVFQSYDKSSKQDLIEAGDSFTTSQWDLRMGGQPNNTPDERAMYKVRRSPSAESEEFLRVDISIRGGTSYLPSEARRIHTPPLPGEGPNGKRRGFFFDYNAPQASTAHEISRKSAPRLELPTHIGKIPRRSTSQAPTVPEQTPNPSKRSTRQDLSGVRVKTREWYDRELAQLDSSSEINERHSTAVAKRPGLERGRSMTNRSGISIAECQKRKEEEMLDYDIPDHLPNSPLCPRHPTYWRVVQGRGNQFRGCWMHGIGVWGEGEGKIASSSPF